MTPPTILDSAEKFIAENVLPNSPSFYELQDYLNNFAHFVLAEKREQIKEKVQTMDWGGDVQAVLLNDVLSILSE